MSAVRCPRCRREVPELSAFCTGCGAPLLLRDDGPAPPLEGPVELDRRGRGRGAGGAATVGGLVPPPLPAPAATSARPDPAPRATPRAGELAAVERSSWELGKPPGDAPAEPSDERSSSIAPPATADVPDPEVDALEVHVARAEPWRRAVAWLVDGVPFVAAGGALASSLVGQAAAGRRPSVVTVEDLVDLVARERVIVLSVACAVALALATYATLAHALAGATLGKRLVRIRVVGPDGGNPSPARSAVRSLLAIASAGLLGLGFVLALFTRTGRALHDLVARTWVVKAP